MDKSALLQHVRTRRAAGVRQSAIASELGVTRQYISLLCQEIGVPASAAVPNGERLKRLPALLRRGLTNQQIAKAFGVGASSVSGDLKGLPGAMKLVDHTARMTPAAKRRGLLPALIRRGMTTRQMAAHLGVRMGLVQKDLKAMAPLPKALQEQRIRNRRDADPRCRAAAARRSQIKALTEEGLSTREIAGRLEARLDLVHKDLQKLRLAGSQRGGAGAKR